MSELGNRLKEARLQKGLSLDDLQEITKIQMRYLVGIEEGNYSMMPGKFYVRAFIKQYAEAVDLSVDELFEEYKSEIPTSINDEIPDNLSRVKTKESIDGRSHKVFEYLPAVFIVIVVVGILFLVWYLWPKGTDESTDNKAADKKDVVYQEAENTTNNTNEQTTAKEDETKKETTVEDEKKEEEKKVEQEISVVESKGKKTTYEVTNSDVFKVKLVSKGKTWVNIKNGKGYSFYQGLLEKGATASKEVDLSKETEAVLVVGNSVDTEIYVNEQKVKYEIKPTDVVAQEITIRFNKAEETDNE